MKKKAHFIGICGAGMSAVAHLLLEKGYVVTGSDEGFYPPISDYVTKLGLECSVGYKAENIPEDVDVIVIGKNAKLVPETNGEVAYALNNFGDKVKSFPEVLAGLSENKRSLVVAGSYGKSTTTSIATWVLLHAQKDPSYFIGALPKDFGHSASIGKGKYFVFEGDEYPSANWDNRSKFMHYDPDIVLLTSASHDHVNIYPTIGDYHKPFHDLLNQLHQKNGKLVACIDEPNAKQFYGNYEGEKISYGQTSHADWYAKDIVIAPISSFTLMNRETELGRVETSLLGKHNIENIVGVAAVLIGEKMVTFSEFREAITLFNGITRRMDKKTLKSKIDVYEGFGSSYDKARAAISAMRDHFTNKKLVVLFEPHTFTWRNKDAIEQYKTAFGDVEEVFIYEPPTQGKGTHNQATLDEIVDYTSDYHAHVKKFGESNMEELVRLTDDDSVVLILSSGNFGGNLKKIISLFEQYYG